MLHIAIRFIKINKQSKKLNGLWLNKSTKNKERLKKYYLAQSL